MTMDNPPPQDEFLSDQELEYAMAESYIDEFTDVLLDLPPIKDIPTNTSFQAYLTELAGVIADILPLAPDPNKIGVSTIVMQAKLLHLATKRARNGQSLGVENDCKLGPIVTGNLLAKLADRQHWPLQVEYGIGKDAAHAYAIVHINEVEPTEDNFPFTHLADTAYLVHFLPFGEQTLGAVNPHGEDSLLSLQQPDEDGTSRLITRTTLTDGMQLFDEIYERAVEQRKNRQ
jgi:hypothetical protein